MLTHPPPSGGSGALRRSSWKWGAPQGWRGRELPTYKVSAQPVSASAAHILGEVCREKQEAAIPLVRLLLHYGRVVPFISAIASAEVKRTQ